MLKSKRNHGWKLKKWRSHQSSFVKPSSEGNIWAKTQRLRQLLGCKDLGKACFIWAEEIACERPGASQGLACLRTGREASTAGEAKQEWARSTQIWKVGKSQTAWGTYAVLKGLEKEMATHSSVLAWRIPGMAEPGGLPSMGSHRVGHDWSDLAAAKGSRLL